MEVLKRVGTLKTIGYIEAYLGHSMITDDLTTLDEFSSPLTDPFSVQVVTPQDNGHPADG